MSLYTVNLRFPRAQNRLCQHYAGTIEAETKQEAIFIVTQQAKKDGFQGAAIKSEAVRAREVGV